jgi:hypothetical protein
VEAASGALAAVVVAAAGLAAAGKLTQITQKRSASQDEALLFYCSFLAFW